MVVRGDFVTEREKKPHRGGVCVVLTANQNNQGDMFARSKCHKEIAQSS